MLTFVNSIPRIPLAVEAEFNSWMDVYEIRRRNLDVLKAEAETFVAIADAMRRAKQGANPPEAADGDYANVLSQIKGRHRNMGTQVARDIEVAMEKPFGWMDWPHFEAAYEVAQIMMEMDADDRAHWMRVLRAWRDAKPSPQTGPTDPFEPIPKG